MSHSGVFAHIIPMCTSNKHSDGTMDLALKIGLKARGIINGYKAYVFTSVRAYGKRGQFSRRGFIWLKRN